MNRRWMKTGKALDNLSNGVPMSCDRDEFVYRLTVLGSDDEDEVSPARNGGFTRFAVPFDGDEQALLEEALSHVGVHTPDRFTIESAEDGGFVIRDNEEPFLSLALEEDIPEDDDEMPEVFDAF